MCSVCGWLLTKKDLVDMTANRDLWKGRAVKEFWAIVAMVVCAVLYIVFKILAARVKVV